MVAMYGPGDYLPSLEWVRASGMIMMSLLQCSSCLRGELPADAVPAGRRSFRRVALLLMALIPVPFVAMLAGWIFREAAASPGWCTAC